MTLAPNSIPPKILQRIHEVPLLSSQTSQLLAISNVDNHTLQDMVTIVKCDAALTANLLKVANSAAFAFSSKILAIERAITLLGENMVIGIALAEAAAPLFQCQLAGYAGQSGDLWEHNLLTAIAAKKVAKQANSPVAAEVAFTCGLLHDIGKAILSTFLGSSSEQALSAIDSGQTADYLSAERTLLGLDHARVGYELACHWRLPEPIPSAILHHHQPAAAEPEHKALVYTVHLGDMMAMMIGSGTGADAMRYRLDQGYTEYIDLSADQLGWLLFQVNEEFKQVKASLAARGEPGK